MQRIDVNILVCDNNAYTSKTTHNIMYSLHLLKLK